MTSDLTLIVLRAALFTSLAIALLLVARKPLRRWLGATLAYQAWLTVPLVTIAAILPSSSTPTIITMPVLRSAQALAEQAVAEAPAQIDFLLIVWVCGVLALAAWFFAAHQVFLRMAGRLTRSGDIFISDADVGPASVGLLSPKIIVPHDFAQRYSPHEQTLVIAHEQTHITRRDAVANVLTAVFQCVFWFNPLVHIGARCLRQDQELACDAVVMQHHPRQRRVYAEALLKFHTGASAINAGINCHWQTHHPTKERLMNLQQTPFGTVRRLAGRSLVALLAVGAITATLSVRAEQAASAPSYSVAMTLDAGGEQSTPRVVTKAGEKFAIASGDWHVEMILTQAPKLGDVKMESKVFKGNELISAPKLLTSLNEKATIKVGRDGKEFALSMVVSPQP